MDRVFSVWLLAQGVSVSRSTKSEGNLSWQCGERFGEVSERGHWCHPGCCNAVPHSVRREQENTRRSFDRALGTLSTELNAPSNFMHTLSTTTAFSLGLVQILNPRRPCAPSVSAYFFARLETSLVRSSLFIRELFDGIEREVGVLTCILYTVLFRCIDC